MANNIVENPYSYFGDISKGRPVFNGSIYVGEPDLDPKIVANQKTLTARQEDGTEVAIAQPVSTNNGGYAVDSNGNIVLLLVDGNYAIRIDDKGDNLVYKQANVLKGTPLTIEKLGIYTSLTFDNVADLKSGTLPDGTTVVRSVGDTGETLGYTTVNDGGNGKYVISASTGTDDGGKRIDLTDGSGLQAQLIINGSVSVNQFGSIGDGLTNNSIAWANADALGVDLTVSNGSHAISIPITIENKIKFFNGGLVKSISGALIIFNGEIEAGGHKIFDMSGLLTGSETAGASQTVFTTPVYTIGGNNLFVEYNTMDMTIAGYTETSTTSITLGTAPPSGTIMDFVVGGVQFGNLRNTFKQTKIGYASPEWWGATGVEGSGDDTEAVQFSFDSGRPIKFLQDYPVSQVALENSDLLIFGDGFKLIGNAVSSTTSVFEMRCQSGIVKDLRVSCQFNTFYECAIHWYTNLLPGVITGVFGAQPGNVRMWDIQGESALIGLCIGALPTQSSDPMPPQESSTTPRGTAINAPISESHVFGFKTENCLIPVRMRQANGKVTFTGSIASPSFGSFSTSLGTIGITIPGVDGGEINWVGGAVENVVDADGLMINIENGTLTIDSAVVEAICGSHIAGDAKLHLGKLANFGLNTNNFPWFGVFDTHTGSFTINDLDVFMPANRFDVGTSPFIKVISDANFTQSVNDNLVVAMSNVRMQDIPWNDIGSQYMQPVTGGRVVYNNCTIESIPSAGAARDQLFKLSDRENLLPAVCDTSFDLISAYPQVAGATEQGWTFSVTSGSNSWGSVVDVPTPELTTVSKSIRLTSIAGQEARATSASVPAISSGSYRINMWLKTGGTTATFIVRCEFFKFDGTASSTPETNMLFAQETTIGTVFTPFQGIIKTPSDATKMKLVVIAEGGADITFSVPGIV